MPKNVVQEKIKISKKYTAAERRAIANEIIDYLQDRTAKGHGKNDKPWKTKGAQQYSKSYKESLDFKQKKGKGRKVDLSLSSDMLTAVKQLKSKPGEISVGIGVKAEEWKRAKGNVLGTYGQKKPLRGKSRNFLELSKKEVTKILEKRFPLDDPKKRAKSLLAYELATAAADALGGENDVEE